MESFRGVLPDVWREVCRHLEIAESTGPITQMLLRALPIDLLLVRRLDRERGCIETVGLGGPQAESAPRERTEPSPALVRKLIAWMKRGETVTCGAGTPAPADVQAALPAESGNERLVGPLIGEHGAMGLLVVESVAGKRFNAGHRALFEQVVEPLAVALDNDHRLRELNALREAAEADKRSLLNRLGREELVESVVGADAGLRPVMQRVELVARSDAPVLILGETGSGKEVVARAIHTRSRRAGGPFIRVNCGAIAPELIDSELFGHEKGAFTGAAGVRRGWFERADEGTLFLDEIGDLPPAAQVRLLRILAEGTFERVGGERTLAVDVRIVAATHRDLPSMVRQGKFREDLWYRVAVFPVMLPPLREHKEDVAALARHFAARAARRFGLPAQTPTPADVALLRAYDWPGNVRELASVIDRAAILGDGERLEVGRALGVTLPASPPPAPTPAPVIAPAPAAATAPTIAPLAEAMKAHIEAALALCHGRIEGRHGIAKRLGINPHTLRARMRKLKIDWASFRRADDTEPDE